MDTIAVNTPDTLAAGTRVATSRSGSMVATRLWHRAAFASVMLLAVGLHFFRLDQEGYANLYYAATVKSMLTSWHNFYFASFDPGGFVTVDKPPLGLWVQAASAALFGFSGVSLLLPQALAGVLSVALLYHLVSRVFGPTAGLLAALTLTVTPITVAANRNNTMDSLLVLTSLLAAWAVSRAVETGRLRWLLLCAVLVGLGFNIKMLQAFLVLPAFYLLYLVAPPLIWWKRLVHLALATIVLLIVSLAWAISVDLTPPDERPFIGSSHDNTVMELVIGHNGLARLLPQAALPWIPRPTRPQNPAPPPSGPSPRPSPGPIQPPSSSPGQVPLPFAPPGQPPPPQPGLGSPGGAPAAPFAYETGEPGALRLFNQQLAGQISWLLPLAGIGLIAAAWQTRLSFPLARSHQALLLWAAWLVPQLVFFSIANLFHRYYLEMLAPAIASLVGAGLAAMWNDYRRGRWRGWMLPLALVISATVEARILADFPDWSRWLTPLVVGLCAIAALTLIVLRFARSARLFRLSALVATVGTLALLIAPTVWAMMPVLRGGDSGLPFAGPELLTRPNRPNSLPNDTRLTDYLLANRQDAEFILATLSARDAAPIILATGEPVMALGGFSGNDRILSADQLAARVADNDVRFFLLPPQGGPQQGDTTRWVREHCARVPPRLWQGPGVPGGELYDCLAKPG
jgi:4-amino-4-deoxy-L-arabinose transferase-like glycosyltransferase